MVSKKTELGNTILFHSQFRDKVYVSLKHCVPVVNLYEHKPMCLVRILFYERLELNYYSKHGVYILFIHSDFV